MSPCPNSKYSTEGTIKKRQKGIGVREREREKEKEKRALRHPDPISIPFFAKTPNFPRYARFR